MCSCLLALVSINGISASACLAIFSFPICTATAVSVGGPVVPAHVCSIGSSDVRCSDVRCKRVLRRCRRGLGCAWCFFVLLASTYLFTFAFVPRAYARVANFRTFYVGLGGYGYGSSDPALAPGPTLSTCMQINLSILVRAPFPPFSVRVPPSRCCSPLRNMMPRRCRGPSLLRNPHPRFAVPRFPCPALLAPSFS